MQGLDKHVRDMTRLSASEGRARQNQWLSPQRPRQDLIASIRLYILEGDLGVHDRSARPANADVMLWRLLRQIWMHGWLIFRTVSPTTTTFITIL